MAFTLPSLPYAHDALEPHIDKLTMEIHHGKHHQAYVDNLNKAVAGTENESKSLEELVAAAGKISPAVRNNGGGHWNHSFFWKNMTSPAQSGEPSTDLKAALEKTFGSFEKFKAAFEAAGVAHFGSGWVWLIKGPEGDLEILTTPNQDNPIMEASSPSDIILGNDLWEHAYYLKYKNKRADYLKNWWKVANWKQISENYAAAI